ncbi:hypothetical protein Lal_00012372 [Lupinus albus]|nr:hypothetical protein Lal_00012372 [Lupinus albus]
MEDVLQLEVEISSLRVIVEAGLSELVWTQSRQDQLNLIDGFSGGSLILTDMDGEDLHLTINSDLVKQYYSWESRLSEKGVAWAREAHLGEWNHGAILKDSRLSENCLA